MLRVLKRYLNKNLVITDRCSYPLIVSGQVIGAIDSVSYTGSGISVSGWANAEEVIIASPDTQVKVKTGLLRTDAEVEHNTISNPGFHASFPSAFGPITLGISYNGVHSSLSTHGVRHVGIWKQKAALCATFAQKALRSIPDVMTWRFSHDEIIKQQAKTRIKHRLGLAISDHLKETMLDADVFEKTEQLVPVSAGPITIVLPVYNAFDLLQDCLARIVVHTDVPWHLVVIEDCSTDTAIRPWLRDWVSQQNEQTPQSVTLLENTENLGFIKSVNRAFEYAQELNNNVVLLNSDALVPMGWATRLMAPIEADETVASVTPMSNDAEIFTAPLMCNRTILEPGEADIIDQTAHSFAAGCEVAHAPTGVGFCMGMNLKYLKMLPQFDTCFGRGYGEEVDWCQKVRLKGGIHLGLPSLFVEHRGGESFGSAEKLKLVHANNKVVSKRYPQYDLDVQTFIQNDPMPTTRLALALAWAGARAHTKGARVPIYLAHSLGGGAERYLENCIETRLRQERGIDAVVVLRVGGRYRWNVELHMLDGVIQGATDDFSLVQGLLSPLHAVHLYYSNGVGDRDPVTLPTYILSLKRSEADKVTVLMHDFFPLSPSYTLINDNDQFHGVPVIGAKDASHRTKRTNGEVVTLTKWREAWGKLMTQADEIEVFSNDSARHVCSAYPEVSPLVKPHTLPVRPAPLPKPALSAAPVIGVLGNIGKHKGAAVLAGMGKYVGSNGLVVIGNVDPVYDLGPNATIHGDFDPLDINEIAQKYGITAWFIPSLWPETFSYTTHECIATQLPVWSFDLGAQAEAITAAVDQGAAGGVFPINMVSKPMAIIKRINSTNE